MENRQPADNITFCEQVERGITEGIDCLLQSEYYNRVDEAISGLFIETYIKLNAPDDIDFRECDAHEPYQESLYQLVQAAYRRGANFIFSHITLIKFLESYEKNGGNIKL